MLAALDRSRRFIRGEIGRRVVLKYVPELRFEADTSFANADAMRATLDSEPVRRDLGPRDRE